MPTSLTPHFTLEELVLSQTAAREGIDNTPSPAIVEHLKLLASSLEEVRTLLGGTALLISSGYRCEALNTAVNGSRSSDHILGLAADFTAPRFGDVLSVARAIAGSGLPFKQLIHEYGGWVHIGLARPGEASPRKTMSIFKGTGYLPGLVARPP